MKKDRNFLVVGTAWIGKIVNAITTLLVIRIITSTLGVDYASVFIVLTGLLGWYMLADLGIGSSIQNFISESKAYQQPYDKYVCLATYAGISLLVIGVGLSYFLSFEIGEVLLGNFTFLKKSEMTLLFFVSASLYISMIVGTIGYKIWYAEHRGYLANIAPGIGGVIGVILVYFVQQVDVENKILLSIGAYLSPLAGFALLSLFYRIRLSSEIFQFEWSEICKVFRRGFGFFCMTLTQAFIVNIDYIILAMFFSSQDILIYGIVSRIFGFAAYFYTSVYTGLWPRFTELIAKKDWQPVKKMLWLSYSFSVCLIVFFSFLLTLNLNVIIDFLTPGQSIHVSRWLIVLLTLYHLVIAWVHGFGIVLQSMSDTKPFLFWMPIQAVGSVVLQLLLVPMFGLYGLVMGMLLSFILTLVWVLPLRVRKHIVGKDVQPHIYEGMKS